MKQASTEKPTIIPMWITKTGERIPIDELTGEHLDNILKHLEGKLAVLDMELGSCFAYCGGGEMAEYYALGAVGDVQKKVIGIVTWRDMLRAEKDRRNVKFFVERKCDECSSTADIVYYETKEIVRKRKVVAIKKTFAMALCKKHDKAYRKETDPRRFGLDKKGRKK